MRVDGRQSRNIEDRRGSGVAAKAGGPLVGCGGLIVALIYVALGGDPRDAARIVAATQQMAQSTEVQGGGQPVAGEEELVRLVSVVLADTEDVWTKVFAGHGATYQEPALVLFRGKVDSACGRTSAAVGPFYCPADHKAYIDLSFYAELRRRFGAPGDFAQAYVIAHEIGHHVQNLLGTSAKVARAEQRASEVEANALSVRLELQADCYAGVWAHHAHKDRHVLEAGDVEEALTAAKAIGDDALQKQAQGYTVPETWTHGSSAARSRWFKVGLEKGTVEACDTFAAGANVK